METGATGCMTMKHTITALRVQKRNPERVNVYLDGEFAFGLARIVAAWLEIGQEIDDSKIDKLRAQDEREATYQRALRFLSYRPRTESEVVQNLRKHAVEEPVIEETIERLRRASLLDDSQFARSWVENRTIHRPRGRRALAYELRQKGVDRGAIDQALEDVDEEQLAMEAARQQARKYRSLEWNDFRKKMFGYLSRRGFGYEYSANAIIEVWNENTNDKSLSDDEVEQ